MTTCFPILHQRLWPLYGRREAGVLTDVSYWKATRDSFNLIQRLTRTRTLMGHHGCVNTIAWNYSGSKLISGSDDRHLKIYDQSTGLELASILTGHQSNIFSAKFLPDSSDAKAVSCAGIGSVEYSELSPTGEYISHPFQCHRSITYQVATTPGDGNEFMTCEEKGYVRLYDLRVKTECSCNGCSKDVLYHFPASVSSIAVNPISPYYIAFGLGDGTVQVLDRRKANRSLQHQNLMGCDMSSSKAIQRKYSVGNRVRKITSVQFNQDGSQLLASYSEDYVYLFNSGLFGCGAGDTEIIKPTYLSQYECYSPAVPRKRKSGRVKVKNEHQATGVLSRGLNPKEQHPPVKKLRLRGDWSDTGPEARPEAEAPRSDGRTLMNHMSHMFSQWIDMSLSSEERGREGGIRNRAAGRRRRREEMARNQSQGHGENSREEGRPERGSESLNSSTSSSNNSFELEEQACCEHDTDVSNSGSNLPQIKKNDGDNRASEKEDTGSIDSRTRGNNDLTNHIFNDAHNIVVDEMVSKNTAEEARTDVAVSDDQTQERPPRLCPLASNSGDSSAERTATAAPTGNNFREIPSISVVDSDDGGSCKSRTNSGDTSCDQVVDEGTGDYVRGDVCASESFIKPFLVYKGHRNSRTMIKQANFFGDNWVLSGSDCGRMFVWNKWTGEIVNMLLADSHVVNCVQPHPQAYLIATSGIDYDVKFWEPLDRELCSLLDINKVTERNHVMLEESRNTITMPSMIFLRVLSYLNRRRRERGEEGGVSGDQNVSEN